MVKYKIILIVLCSIIVLALTMANIYAGELDFRLTAQLNDTSTVFYTETQADSTSGYDGNDAEISTIPDALPSVLYSSVGSRVLVVDSWNNSVLTRTINLVYQISSRQTGTLNLSWTSPNSGFSILLKDYGIDLGYSSPITHGGSTTIDMSSVSSYSFIQGSDGFRCFQLVITYTPPSTPGGGSPGGGGGSGTVNKASIKIGLPSPISVESAGPLEFNITLTNDGTVNLAEISLSGSMTRNSGELNSALSFDKILIPNLAVGAKELVNVKTYIQDEQVSVYEIMINVSSKTPYYKTQGRVYLTFIGKNVSGIVKIVAFTEGLINENAECLELKDMINDAKKDLEANPQIALEKAQKALEACKNILNSPTKPVVSQSPENRMFIYVGIAVIAAIVFGLLFNFYRLWKFKHQTNKKTKGFGFKD